MFTFCSGGKSVFITQIFFIFGSKREKTRIYCKTGSGFENADQEKSLGSAKSDVDTMRCRLLLPRAVLGIREILVPIRMRIRILGSVPLTNRSGCGSGRPRNIRIRIRETCTFSSFFKDKSHKEVTKE
jgi:hypothetical protein